ncbi:FIG035246: DoxX family protein [hydrothermal vent metagenome]|uniref:FIG035246: DoxX family protein n=1 Tax=hydrothermal vent metagenome TaxID=652676 RepID=A0A3B0YQS9_9ZZZZ
MNIITSLGCAVYTRLDQAGAYISMLGLRVLLAYEYLDAGIEKYNGKNWFGGDDPTIFVFPFNLIPADVNWFMVTWVELIGGVAILLGFATRFFSASLIILTIVAIFAVHAGNGYNVGDNGYKLPLIYLVMFVPLLFSGAGKLSIDALIKKFWINK